MKALTLTQPWASLVAAGEKTVETRSWGTPHRGPVAIHAAKGLGPVGGKSGLRDLVQTEPFLSALRRAGYGGLALLSPAEALPLGEIIAVASLEAVVRTDDHAIIGLTEQELAFGNFGPGRYAWILRAVTPLDEHVPCRGALGLWNTPEGLL